MNHELRALQISFAVHISAIILFIAAANFFAAERKPPVIDFTVVDLVQPGGEENSPLVSGHRPSHKKPAEESIEEKLRTTYSNPDAERARPKPYTANSEPAKSSSPWNDIGQSLVFSGPGQDVQFQISPDSGKDLGRNKKRGGEVAGEAMAKTTLSSGASRQSASLGDSQSSGGARNVTYLKANFSYIRDMIMNKLTYPMIARQMGWEGKVKLSFTISRDGSAKDIRIIESSGVAILDKTAVQTVRNASPFPRPPVAAQIIIPINYKLH